MERTKITDTSRQTPIKRISYSGMNNHLVVSVYLLVGCALLSLIFFGSTYLVQGTKLAETIDYILMVVVGLTVILILVVGFLYLFPKPIRKSFFGPVPPETKAVINELVWHWKKYADMVFTPVTNLFGHAFYPGIKSISYDSKNGLILTLNLPKQVPTMGTAAYMEKALIEFPNALSVYKAELVGKVEEKTARIKIFVTDLTEEVREVNLTRMTSPRLILGRDSAGSDIFYNPYDAAHLLITGQTRSGKSIEVYSMLAQLNKLDKIRLGHIRVAGVDPTGVLFGGLGEKLGGSALRVSTLQDVEKVKTVFDSLIHEMDTRISELTQKGWDKVTEFYPDYPLTIIVLEEYPGLMSSLESYDKVHGLKPAERLQNKVQLAVKRIASEGLKVGYILWIMSQRGDANVLDGFMRGQLTNRISFKQDPDGLRMIHTGLTPEQIAEVQNFLPGQGLVEFTGSQPLTKFRGDYLTYEQFREYLSR